MCSCSCIHDCICASGRLSVEADVTLTHLFLLEYDPVEEELQVLICIINAELFEAVEGQILWSPHKNTRACIHTAVLCLIYMSDSVIFLESLYAAQGRDS